MRRFSLMTRICLGLFITVFMGCKEVSTTPDMGVNTPDEIQYAKVLWEKMSELKMVGEGAVPTKPFYGGAKPHGMILEVSSQELMLMQHSGFLVIKKNYSGDGVSVAAVEQNRAKFLTSLTVMYQREEGYDPDNQNWFWAKYHPDGSLYEKQFQNTPLKLAGKLIKTKDERNFGCLYCHSSAGGGDYIFYPEIKNPSFNYPSPVK